MNALRVIQGQGTKPGQQNPLLAGLTAAWEAEVLQARVLEALSSASPPRTPRYARLAVQGQFSRAHASRLMARLVHGGRPLMVPFLLDVKPAGGVESCASVALELSRRYTALAELAAAREDLSTAGVCKLNATESADQARELLALTDS